MPRSTKQRSRTDFWFSPTGRIYALRAEKTPSGKVQLTDAVLISAAQWAKEKNAAGVLRRTPKARRAALAKRLMRRFPTPKSRRPKSRGLIR